MMCTGNVDRCIIVKEGKKSVSCAYFPGMDVMTMKRFPCFWPFVWITVDSLNGWLVILNSDVFFDVSLKTTTTKQLLNIRVAGGLRLYATLVTSLTCIKYIPHIQAEKPLGVRTGYLPGIEKCYSTHIWPLHWYSFVFTLRSRPNLYGCQLHSIKSNNNWWLGTTRWRAWGSCCASW